MSINQVRSLLYKTARALGDVNAVARGKVLQRLTRNAVGRGLGSVLSRLFRGK